LFCFYLVVDFSALPDTQGHFTCPSPPNGTIAIETDSVRFNFVLKLSEQELDLLAELVAISADYSKTRDFHGTLTAFKPVTGITDGK
jgi:hypothetical protein